jgi:hypothetical protein
MGNKYLFVKLLLALEVVNWRKSFFKQNASRKILHLAPIDFSKKYP